MNISPLLEINDNLYLKELSTNQATPKYVDWLNDYEVVQYTEQKDKSHTLDSVRLFIEDKVKSSEEFLYGIYYEDQHIGNVKIGPVAWDEKTAELSYLIGEREFWGRGIASEIIKAATAYCLNNLGLKKVIAGVYENNIASIKALEKNGFTKTDKIENRFTHEDSYIECQIYTKLNND